MAPQRTPLDGSVAISRISGGIFQASNRGDWLEQSAY